MMDLTNMLNMHRKQGWPAQADFSYNMHQRHPEQIRDPAAVHMPKPHGQSNLGMNHGYPTQNGMSHGMHVPNALPAFPDMSGVPNMAPNVPVAPMPPPQRATPPQPTKMFPCNTCGKHFARRSDLARHDKIHSGVRPHQCDYPNCGKQFIQRSALTVHSRVHTGEKPHCCEICAKPFSDSSSLARHRRTHSGKRPYKCPFANCQKTFTRRTTLTRHQNHHSGTIEEAEVATRAALSASKGKPGQARSEGDQLSTQGSPLTTPSPAQRTLSMSPSVDLSGAGGMPRHPSDLQYMQQGGPLPVHLRGVGSPTSTSSAGYSNGIRPTSHPTGYGPPPTLEPSLDQHQAGPTSAGSSPHMSSVGWQSPSHVPSPPQNAAAAGYVYPDPADSYPSNLAMNQMYYNPAQQPRRHGGVDSGMVHM